MDRADPPSVVRLAAFDLELELLPATGGSIGRFTLARDGRRIELMRPADPANLALGGPRGTASYPLVPFSGRIAWGRFRFDGRDVELPANMPPEPHAIHGDGWTAAWTVAESGPARAVLAYDHAAGAWPWAYRAEQTFELTPAGLTVTMAVENRGPTPMPAGIGLHPYFPRAPETRVTARVPRVLVNDMAKLPVAVIETPPAWDLAAGRSVAELHLDSCFTGWDGAARLDWAGHSLVIEADPVFGCLVVYTQPAYVCVEPVSHEVDAVNRGVEAAGLHVLPPGGRLAGSVRFKPELRA